MSTKLVFPMHNNYDQGGRAGICTCSSFQWVKKTLERNRGLGSFDELSLSPHQMNAVMAQLRKLDADPTGQSELMGLVPVGADITVAALADVIRHTLANAPHIGIFWTQEHTMGVRCGKENEFFDIENGLWLSSSSDDLRKKMREIFRDGSYGPAIGMRILKLKS
jgi:hypothetical protein